MGKQGDSKEKLRNGNRLRDGLGFHPYRMYSLRNCLRMEGRNTPAGASGWRTERQASMSQQTKTTEERHAKRLRNSNPVGDPSQAARCGAQTRSGAACQGPAMANGRCRMHGGPSTGPRTPEGLANSRQAQWKHGLYSAERKRLRRQLRWVGEFARVLSRIDKMFPNATRVCTSSPLGAFASYRRSLSSA